MNIQLAPLTLADDDFDTEAPTEPRIFICQDFDAPIDTDETAVYVLAPPPRAPSIAERSLARRRQIRATRQDIAGLRDAIEEGWDVGLELAHEERRLAELEDADLSYRRTA